jgi:hypothetical protein
VLALERGTYEVLQFLSLGAAGLDAGKPQGTPERTAARGTLARRGTAVTWIGITSGRTTQDGTPCRGIARGHGHPGSCVRRQHRLKSIAGTAHAFFLFVFHALAVH